MPLEPINLGTAANNRTGDTWRAGGEKINRLIPTSPGQYILDQEQGLVPFQASSSVLQWAFDSNTSIGDPGTGKYRLDNADPILADTIIFSSTTLNDLNLETGRAVGQENSIIAISKSGEPTSNLLVEVGEGGAIDLGGYFTLPVTVLQSNGSFSDGDIVEIQAFRQSEILNVINVNSILDFPEPVGNTIELTNGRNMVYVLQSELIDVGNVNFTVTGGSCVINCLSRYNNGIISTSSDNMFIVRDASIALEFIRIAAPNCDYVLDFVNVSGFNSIVFQNTVISDVKSIATVDGAFTTSLRTLTVGNTTVGGFDWVGAGNNQINVSTSLGVGIAGISEWQGVLFNLGSAVFSSIEITSSELNSTPGGTIISGLPNNGNLTATGRGVISSNILNGTGVKVVGLDPQDTQYEWNNNNPQLFNTRVNADTFLTSTQAVTIASANTPVPIAGGNWQSDLTNRFTVDADGLMTYIGLEDIDVFVSGTVTMENDGMSDLICAYVAQDGTAVVKSKGCTESNEPTSVTCNALLTLSNGSTLQMYVENATDTSNINVVNSNMVVQA